MIYDVIGIGFGPSNIALAIAMEEAGYQGKALFLVRRLCRGGNKMKCQQSLVCFFPIQRYNAETLFSGASYVQSSL